MKRDNRRTWVPLVLASALLHLALSCPSPAGSGATDTAGSPPAAQAAPRTAAGNDNGSSPAPARAEKFSREGVVVEFSYEPAGKRAGGVVEGEFVDLRFRVTDEAKGNPVRSLRPGAWMDISRPPDAAPGQEPLDCRKKVGLYLQGIVGIRPMLDLNGYFIVVMNQEPNLYVIDPFVGIAGKTNLLGTVRLREPGTDWAKTADEKRLYVTLNKAGKVAVVDTETFKLLREVDAGEGAVRPALQPDGQLLWIGNDAPEGKEGGVTAIDTGTLAKVASIPTGKGHHELAFSTDSRFAYATNRGSGTVSVIDVRERRKVRDVPVGPQPISLGYSAAARALYVADGQDGAIAVVDGKSHEVTARIQAKPGLGPMRFTPDGRWGLILNSRENAVHIVDASNNRLAYTVAVGETPYQIALTRGFAHVRCLGTERVFMVNLDLLGKDAPPGVQSYGVGSGPPKDAPGLGIASGIASVTGQSEVLVVNPVSNTVFFYMDGMNFTSGSFPGYRQHPRGVETINRSVRETEPGVYTARARVPVAGEYDVALFMDSPRFVHCFALSAGVNPELRKEAVYEVEYLREDPGAVLEEEYRFRFRLKDPLTGWPVKGLADARLLYSLSPGRYRTEVPAREVEEGVYEGTLRFREPGAYNVYIGVPSRKIGYQTLIHRTLVVRKQGDAAGGGAPGAKEPKGAQEPKESK
ncbi:MAG TPA: YncE family protein [Candidatus Deferrimicrobiaceae bacterium]